MYLKMHHVKSELFILKWGKVLNLKNALILLDTFLCFLDEHWSEADEEMKDLPEMKEVS